MRKCPVQHRGGDEVVCLGLAVRCMWTSECVRGVLHFCAIVGLPIFRVPQSPVSAGLTSAAQGCERDSSDQLDKLQSL